MITQTRSLVAVLLAASAAGCSSGFSETPLVGTWTRPFMALSFNGTESYELNSDGTLVVTVTGASGACTGSFTYTGFSWAATMDSLTFSGTPQCSGALVCGATSIDCSQNQGSLQAGFCTYVLAADSSTVTLTKCSGMADGTLTRAN